MAIKLPKKKKTTSTSTLLYFFVRWPQYFLAFIFNSTSQLFYLILSVGTGSDREPNGVCTFRISNLVGDGDRIQRQPLHKELSAMTEGPGDESRGTLGLGVVVCMFRKKVFMKNFVFERSLKE